MLTQIFHGHAFSQMRFRASIEVDMKHYSASKGARWDQEVSLLPCRCKWAGRGPIPCKALSMPRWPAMHAPLRPCNTLTKKQPP